LQKKSGLGPFLDDIQGYLILLRRHSFLRYISDTREYNVRRMVVVDGIVHALGQASGVSLPVIHEEVPVESLLDVSVASVQRLMRQTIRNLKRSLLSLESGSARAAEYRQAISRWEGASRSLRAVGSVLLHGDR
jgi:hypothetical protein